MSKTDWLLYAFWGIVFWLFMYPYMWVYCKFNKVEQHKWFEY